MAYLLKLLLQKEKIVVIEARKEPATYAFIPPSEQGTSEKDGKYKVYRCNTFDASSCVLLRKPTSYYLIDVDKPASIPSPSAHTVVCSSPKEDQYKTFMSRRGTLMWIMPIWKKEEISAVAKVFPLPDGSLLTGTELAHRYQMFGGRIRYLFNSSAETRKYESALSNSINRLSNIDLLAASLTAKNAGEIDEVSAPSLLFVFDVVQDATSGRYRMLKAKENYALSFASDYVRYELAVRCWKQFMRNFQHSTNTLGYAKFFELLVSVLLEIGGDFKTRAKDSTTTTLTLPPATQRVDVPGSWDDFVYECNKLASITTQNSNTRKILVPCTRNQTVMDICDGIDRIYQVTLGKDHGISRSHIENIVQHLKPTQLKPLYLYFVVLSSHFDGFRWSFEGDFESVSKKTKALEAQTRDELQKNELATLDLTKIVKEKKNDLVKRIMVAKNIQGKTTEEAQNDILAVLSIHVLCVPEDVPSHVTDILDEISNTK